MNKCLQCGKEVKQTIGKKMRLFCNDACRIAHIRTVEKERYILDSNGKIQTANNGLIARMGKCHNCGENVPDTICICYDCFHKKGATHENLGLAMCTPID